MTLSDCAAALAYSLGVALYLHPDGRIRIIVPEGEDPALWARIEPAPGAAPTPHGHGSGAEAQAQP